VQLKTSSDLPDSSLHQHPTLSLGVPHPQGVEAARAV